jgi:hypothetical protein
MEFKLDKYSDLVFYYRLKKLTQVQKTFIEDLASQIIDVKTSILEFPPTLDKDYLLDSTVYTIANKLNQKFIILVKDTDNIHQHMKNFSSIQSIARKFNSNSKIQVIPFYDRKSICLNEKLLENSSNLDFDTYCSSATASWVPKNTKCVYYLVNRNINLEFFK